MSLWLTMSGVLWTVVDVPGGTAATVTMARDVWGAGRERVSVAHNVWGPLDSC